MCECSSKHYVTFIMRMTAAINKCEDNTMTIIIRTFFKITHLENKHMVFLAEKKRIFENIGL